MIRFLDQMAQADVPETFYQAKFDIEHYTGTGTYLRRLFRFPH